MVVPLLSPRPSHGLAHWNRARFLTFGPLLWAVFVLLHVLSIPAFAQVPRGTSPYDPRLDAPLLEATEAGDSAKVKDLLDKGANPQVRNRFGWPVSVLAAHRGYTEVLRQLYTRDHDTTDQNASGGWTPLLAAVMHNHLETVRFLLACHAEPQMRTEEGFSATEYAEGHGYADILAALRGASGEPPAATPAATVESPLVNAATAGDAVALAKLLNQGEPVESRNTSGKTLLICAAKADQLEAVRLLLAHHANPNNLSRDGYAPLDFAADHSSEEVVKLLLEAGADPNGFRASDSLGDTYSPLFLSFRMGRLAVAKLLLAHGARLNDTNNIGDTALHEAARRPYVEVLRFLVEQGQSVNAANRFGYTPLIFAASKGCEENIRFLLAKGADLHAKAKNRNPDRHTGQPLGAFEAAALDGEPYAQEILADAGATPANPGAKLTEELFSAMDGKDFERVQAALHKGASPNAPDAGNRQPLATAVLIGDPGIVRLLLKAGANPNGTSEDASAYTPLENARERQTNVKDALAKQNFTRIIDLLQQAHATR